MTVSKITISVIDKTIDTSSLKYVWTNSEDVPTDEEYIHSYVSGNPLTEAPITSGTYYLHAIASDLNDNVARFSKSFLLDTLAPEITITGDSTITIELGSTYTDQGATATDDISGNLSVSTKGDVNINAVGTYTITYTATDEAGNVATATRTVNVTFPPSEYSFTGSQQTFIAPVTGTYKLEVWGAQGGSDWKCDISYAGKGSYSTGNVTINANETIYIYVGGMCYNGGGGTTSACSSGYGGGGATDIRMGGTDLSNRIIVAGGGGSAGHNELRYDTSNSTQCIKGGAGGGSDGVDGLIYSGTYHTSVITTNIPNKGGTQTAGGQRAIASTPRTCTYTFEQWAGSAGTLGVGGDKSTQGGGVGGGGYYGGGGGSRFQCIGNSQLYYVVTYGSGAGGSGYIGGVTDGQTIDGNTSMPNPNGGNMNGRSGDGYAIITFIGAQ